MNRTQQLVATLFLIASLGGAQIAAAEQDPWAPGSRLDEWQRIESIQRYPLYDAEPQFEWPAVCRDASWLVRAAGAMAAGRAREPKLLQFVRPMLRDESAFVRCAALVAILQVESPLIKEPLLEVLGTWDDTELHATFDAAALSRTGLPYAVTQMRLAERQAWLVKFDVANWKVPADRARDQQNLNEIQTRIVMCLEKSELDADQTIPVRLRVDRRGGSEPIQVRLTNYTGFWYPLGFDDEPFGREDHHRRLSFAHGGLEGGRQRVELTVGPDQSGTADLPITMKHNPLPPDVYLFRVDEAQHSLLVRVRRGVAFEGTIPRLLDEIDNDKTIATLAEQRVRAAAPALIALFRDRVQQKKHHTMEVAAALGRVGDPAAIPVLLDFPNVRALDVGGTTRDTLRMFGKLAYPQYEERILAWKDVMANGNAKPVRNASSGPQTLELSLRLLGPNGSNKVDRARLELVEELSKRRLDAAMYDQARDVMVLQAALSAIAFKHPRQAIDTVWAARDRARTCDGLLDAFHRMPRETARPILKELWLRTQADPKANQVLREALSKRLLKMAPEWILEETTPLVSPQEALQLLNAMRSMRARSGNVAAVRDVLERIETFLRETPDAQVQLELATAHYEAGQYERCESLATAAILRLPNPQQVSRAYYYRGNAMIQQGKVADGEQDLLQALERLNAKPGGDPSFKRSIEERLQTVAALPRVPGVRVRESYMTVGIANNSYMELAGGRGFGVDDSRYLVAWDPFRKSGATLAQLSWPVRDFMPLDRNRVFVALGDGTAVLIEEGKDQPLWKRTLSLGINSYLSASPSLITAADEDGMLHALDPQTAKTLWSRQVRGGRWLQSRWQSHHSLIRQAGELVLVPNDSESPTSIDAVELASGNTRWTYRLEFPIAMLAVGAQNAALANRAGDLIQLSLADGSVKWKLRLDASIQYPHNELSMAYDTQGTRVFVGLKDQFWALDSSHGRQLWTWRWSPLPQQGKLGPRGVTWPKVCPSAVGLYCIVNWQSDGRHNDRTDVVLLDDGGNVIVHATSPPPYTTDWANDPLVSGNAIAFRKGHRWEMWQFNPKREEK